RRSLFIFSEAAPTRTACVKILRSLWFERSILTLILINALFQAFLDYRDPAGWATRFVENTEHAFTFCFLVELAIKVIALGFILDEKSYLRDPWSWLDFLVVLSGLISFLFSSLLDEGGGLNVIRTIRILRPLRGFSKLTGLKAIIKTFLLSLPRLGNVAGMFVFLLIIFGIVGLNFYGGVLHRHCRLTPTPVVMYSSSGLTVPNGILVRQHLSSEYRYGFDVDPVYSASAASNAAINISEPFKPHTEDYNFGVTHFDHLGGAVSSIFQSITLEGWVVIMYLFEDSYNRNFSQLYFFLLIVLGVFFILNVTLAIVFDAFSSLQEKTGVNNTPDGSHADVKVGGNDHADGGASTNHSSETSLGKRSNKTGGAGSSSAGSTVRSGEAASNISLAGTSASQALLSSAANAGAAGQKKSEGDPKTEKSAKIGVKNIVLAPGGTAASGTQGTTKQDVNATIVRGPRSQVYLADPETLGDQHSIASGTLGTTTAEEGDVTSTSAEEQQDQGVERRKSAASKVAKKVVAFSTTESSAEENPKNDKEKRMRSPGSSPASSGDTHATSTGAGAVMLVYPISSSAEDSVDASTKGGLGEGVLDGDKVTKRGRKRSLSDFSPSRAARNYKIHPHQLMQKSSSAVGTGLSQLNKRYNQLLADDSHWGHFRRRVFDLTDLETFQLTILFFIVANVITLSLDDYPARPKQMMDVLHLFNHIFFGVFVVEALLLNIAMGPKLYWTSLLTAFDGLILLASCLEILWKSDKDSPPAMTALRALRVFKLAKNMTNFRLLLKSIYGTVVQIGNFVLLLALMIYIFALAGQNFYATMFVFHPASGKFLSEYLPSCSSRANFDVFLWACVTVFQILTGENWNAVFYDAMKAKAGFATILYFSVVVCVGNFVILNVFLAILMCNFEQQSELARQEEAKNKETRAARRRSSQLGRRPTRSRCWRREQYDRDQSRCRNLSEQRKAQKRRRAFRAWIEDLRSCTLRENITLLVLHPSFEQTSMLCILLSCILMTWQNPLADPTSETQEFLSRASLGFTVIFTLECLLKAAAFGLWRLPILTNRYVNDQRIPFFRNGWNWLDLVVVLVGWITELAPQASAVGGLRTLRVFRALRPLRLVSRNPSLKLVVNTLLHSLPELGNLIIVGSIVFLVFALWGLTYFKGKFYSCQDRFFAPFEFDKERRSQLLLDPSDR
ncbi:unnamed protein product, partial [Amoebophrya sp. A25]